MDGHRKDGEMMVSHQSMLRFSVYSRLGFINGMTKHTYKPPKELTIVKGLTKDIYQEEAKYRS